MYIYKDSKKLGLTPRLGKVPRQPRSNPSSEEQHVSSLPTSNTPAQPQNGDLPAAITLEWEQFYRPGPLPDTTARHAWRQAVAAVAAQTKQALPESHGRIEKAVAIVLAGDVELLDGGKARVASQSSGATTYFVVNGTCECKDFPQAPAGQCKHRLAFAIHTRAMALSKATLAQLDAAQQNGHAALNEKAVPMTQCTDNVQPPPVPASQAPADWRQHEPPFVHSLKWCDAERGVEHMTVIRATTAEELWKEVKIVQALITASRAKAPAPPTSPAPAAQAQPAEGWCHKHQVQMTKQRNAKGSWWSHQTAEGWCKGK